MSWSEIYNKIKNKQPDLDVNSLKYFANYFFVLSQRNEISSGINIDGLIDNALLYASAINFYNKEDNVYKELGPDCKGLRDPKTKIIYIRSDLPEQLKEITIYHELHHAIQTNPLNDEVGINQETNYGRLIMEAQTQYFAEEVYKTIHNSTFEDRLINTEDLRMLSGGVICSDLHNYELYDSLISKVCILLEIPKDFLVHINFLYKENAGMNLLMEKYNSALQKYNLPYSFEEFMFRLDYIYCTDLLAYKDNPDKKLILEGMETENQYEIYSNKGGKISLKKEFDIIDEIDRKYFLCLFDNNGDYISFSKYMCKNESRELARQICDAPVEPPRMSNRKYKQRKFNEH